MKYRYISEGYFDTIQKQGKSSISLANTKEKMKRNYIQNIISLLDSDDTKLRIEFGNKEKTLIVDEHDITNFRTRSNKKWVSGLCSILADIIDDINAKKLYDDKINQCDWMQCYIYNNSENICVFKLFSQNDITNIINIQQFEFIDPDSVLSNTLVDNNITHNCPHIFKIDDTYTFFSDIEISNDINITFLYIIEDIFDDAYRIAESIDYIIEANIKAGESLYTPQNLLTVHDKVRSLYPTSQILKICDKINLAYADFAKMCSCIYYNKIMTGEDIKHVKLFITEYCNNYFNSKSYIEQFCNTINAGFKNAIGIPVHTDLEVVLGSKSGVGKENITVYSFYKNTLNEGYFDSVDTGNNKLNKKSITLQDTRNSILKNKENIALRKLREELESQTAVYNVSNTFMSYEKDNLKYYTNNVFSGFIYYLLQDMYDSTKNDKSKSKKPAKQLTRSLGDDTIYIGFDSPVELFEFEYDRAHSKNSNDEIPEKFQPLVCIHETDYTACNNIGYTIINRTFSDYPVYYNTVNNIDTQIIGNTCYININYKLYNKLSPVHLKYIIDSIRSYQNDGSFDTVTIDDILELFDPVHDKYKYIEPKHYNNFKASVKTSGISKDEFIEFLEGKPSAKNTIMKIVFADNFVKQLSKDTQIFANTISDAFERGKLNYRIPVNVTLSFNVAYAYDTFSVIFPLHSTTDISSTTIDPKEPIITISANS